MIALKKIVSKHLSCSRCWKKIELWFIQLIFVLDFSKNIANTLFFLQLPFPYILWNNFHKKFLLSINLYYIFPSVPPMPSKKSSFTAWIYCMEPVSERLGRSCSSSLLIACNSIFHSAFFSIFTAISIIMYFRIEYLFSILVSDFTRCNLTQRDVLFVFLHDF